MMNVRFTISGDTYAAFRKGEPVSYYHPNYNISNAVQIEASSDEIEITDTKVRMKSD